MHTTWTQHFDINNCPVSSPVLTVEADVEADNATAIPDDKVAEKKRLNCAASMKQTIDQTTRQTDNDKRGADCYNERKATNSADGTEKVSADERFREFEKKVGEIFEIERLYSLEFVSLHSDILANHLRVVVDERRKREEKQAESEAEPKSFEAATKCSLEPWKYELLERRLASITKRLRVHLSKMKRAFRLMSFDVQNSMTEQLCEQTYIVDRLPKLKVAMHLPKTVVKQSKDYYFFDEKQPDGLLVTVKEEKEATEDVDTFYQREHYVKSACLFPQPEPTVLAELRLPSEKTATKNSEREEHIMLLKLQPLASTEEDSIEDATRELPYYPIQSSLNDALKSCRHTLLHCSSEENLHTLLHADHNMGKVYQLQVKQNYPQKHENEEPWQFHKVCEFDLCGKPMLHIFWNACVRIGAITTDTEVWTFLIKDNLFRRLGCLRSAHRSATYGQCAVSRHGVLLVEQTRRGSTSINFFTLSGVNLWSNCVPLVSHKREIGWLDCITSWALDETKFCSDSAELCLHVQTVYKQQSMTERSLQSFVYCTRLRQLHKLQFVDVKVFSNKLLKLKPPTEGLSCKRTEITMPYRITSLMVMDRFLVAIASGGSVLLRRQVQQESPVFDTLLDMKESENCSSELRIINAVCKMPDVSDHSRTNASDSLLIVLNNNSMKQLQVDSKTQTHLIQFRSAAPDPAATAYAFSMGRKVLVAAKRDNLIFELVHHLYWRVQKCYRLTKPYRTCFLHYDESAEKFAIAIATESNNSEEFKKCRVIITNKNFDVECWILPEINGRKFTPLTCVLKDNICLLSGFEESLSHSSLLVAYNLSTGSCKYDCKLRHFLDTAVSVTDEFFAQIRNMDYQETSDHNQNQESNRRILILYYPEVELSTRLHFLDFETIPP